MTTGRTIHASPASVYRALTSGDLVSQWRVPDGMTSTVHEFDAREGGRFRVSLTYADGSSSGKSSAHTDTYHGRFVQLVPGERVVEVSEFESEDPALAGEMTMTTSITPVAGGVAVEIVHEGVPDVIAPEANEQGTRMALARLAALVE